MPMNTTATRLSPEAASLIARRVRGGRDPHESHRRGPARTEDHSEAEEHEKGKEEGPEHRRTIARIQAPLVAKLTPEERKRIRQSHLQFLIAQSRRLRPVR